MSMTPEEAGAFACITALMRLTKHDYLHACTKGDAGKVKDIERFIRSDFGHICTLGMQDETLARWRTWANEGVVITNKCGRRRKNE